MYDIKLLLGWWLLLQDMYLGKIISKIIKDHFKSPDKNESQ